MTRDMQALAARALTGRRFVGIATAFVLLLATPLAAQDQGENQDPWADKDSPLHRIEWTDGDQQVDIGAIAEFKIPAACRYSGAKGARDFLLMTENVPTGREEGVLLCRGTAPGEKPWFVIFSFDPSGYVKDDEGKKLDAAKILSAIRAGTERANKVRKAKGWEEMVIDGWVRAPYYDPSTHNLTWSIRGHAASSGESINHSVRLLGRRGVLHADLVADPAQMTSTVAVFDSVIATTEFLRGQRYSEWRKGDKVAAYGLTALIAGGAGVAAVKLGLFAKLGKYFSLLLAKLGKLVIVVVVGLLAGIKSLFTRKKPATA